MHLRFILLDAVGTLMCPCPEVAVAYQRIGQKFGSRLTTQELKARFRAALRRQDQLDVPDQTESSATGLDRRPTDNELERNRWRSIVSEVFCDVVPSSEKLFQSLWDHFSESQNWTLYKDVEPTWTALEKMGCELGIASNFDDRLPRIVAGMPPLDQCKNLFWSSQIGYPKPSPRFFERIQQQLDVEPAEILFVGDNPLNDVQGAREAGWDTILIDRDATTSNDESIRSLLELQDHIRKRGAALFSRRSAKDG